MSFAGEIGRIGEQMVADFLKKQGYIIVRMNFHSPFGEIDIVAEDPQKLLFVEVKTRGESSFVDPADAVDYFKEQKIAKTASVFLKRAHLDMPYRFDVAEVTYRKKNDGSYGFSLNYIKNAFFADLSND